MDELEINTESTISDKRFIVLVIFQAKLLKLSDYSFFYGSILVFWGGNIWFYYHIIPTIFWVWMSLSNKTRYMNTPPQTWK